jgi:hypothetical protein
LTTRRSLSEAFGTNLINGGRSVGIVHSRTEVTNPTNMGTNSTFGDDDSFKALTHNESKERNTEISHR